MKKNILVIAGLAASGLAYAENLEGVDRMVCAAMDVQICIEYDACYTAAPVDLGVPEFVIIDTDDKTISTTRSSSEKRSTAFNSIQKEDGLIYLQGVEGGRAFSFVITEETGFLSVGVATEGLALAVFGACTPKTEGSR